MAVSVDVSTTALTGTPAAAPTSALPTVSGPLRVGIVGAGKMAQNHARAIQRTHVAASLVAIADPSDAATEAMLAITPGARAYDSLEAMLAAERIDVLHVCTPPSTHFRLTELALRSGCHVYVEKPFVESTSEATRLLALAERTGRLVCAGHQLLFEAPTRIAGDYLRAIGRVVHVESYFSFRTVRRAPGGRVPLRPDLQLLDILPHPVYLLLHFLERCATGPIELAGLEVSETGTVHAVVRRGSLTASLVVTLEGRPVESYARIVGTNGSLTADYVRGTVQRQIGPGFTGIDKVFAPYRAAWQLATGTTRALADRVLRKQKSYPGLVELFDAFYGAARDGRPSPVSPESLRETTRIWELVAARLEAQRAVAPHAEIANADRPPVVVTGGTGFLGRELVRTLIANGEQVRVLARREPAAWERVAGAGYVVADLGAPLPDHLLRGARAVVHAAAETAGGWEEHQRNSIDATEHVLRAAARAGVRDVIHVSSIAVLAGASVVRDDSPLEPNARGSGPYVWGKLESERLAVRVGAELGLDLRVVRPGPIVDASAFEAPGRLGKRLGNVFVAVGRPGHRLGVVEVGFAARTLTWMLGHMDDAPAVLNLVTPGLVAKRDLLARMRADNPDLSVVWLPTFVLVPLSWAAIVLQKVLRPGRPAMNVARVFSVQDYDTSRIGGLADRIASTRVPTA